MLLEPTTTMRSGMANTGRFDRCHSEGALADRRICPTKSDRFFSSPRLPQIDTVWEFGLPRFGRFSLDGLDVASPAGSTRSSSRFQVPTMMRPMR